MSAVAVALAMCVAPVHALVHGVGGLPARAGPRDAPVAQRGVSSIIMQDLPEPPLPPPEPPPEGQKDYFIPIFVSVALGGYGVILAADAYANGICIMGSCIWKGVSQNSGWGAF